MEFLKRHTEKYQQGKKISYDIVQLVMEKKESLAQKLWEIYLESSEFDETEVIKLCDLEEDLYNKNEEEDEELEYGKNYTNILNILAITNRQEMLEKYCEKTIEKRKGKILKELKQGNNDRNMYLISAAVECVDDPRYALQLIDKNGGRVQYMAYMLVRACERTEEIYVKMGEDEKQRIQEMLIKEMSVEKIKRVYEKDEQKENMGKLLQKKEIIDRIMNLRSFFKVYQQIYTNFVNVRTFYVNAVYTDDKYIQKKLLEKFEQMSQQEERCQICSERIDKFSTKIYLCEECQNYYHKNCTQPIQTCLLCKNKIKK